MAKPPVYGSFDLTYRFFGAAELSPFSYCLLPLAYCLFLFCSSQTMSTATSAGLTPEMRLA